jgi:hypothetical protein
MVDGRKVRRETNSDFLNFEVTNYIENSGSENNVQIDRYFKMKFASQSAKQSLNDNFLLSSSSVSNEMRICMCPRWRGLVRSSLSDSHIRLLSKHCIYKSKWTLICLMESLFLLGFPRFSSEHAKKHKWIEFELSNSFVLLFDLIEYLRQKASHRS